MRTGSPRHAQFKGQLEDEYAWFTSADSLPGLSIDVTRAASLIVDACVHGEAELVMALTAWMGAKANALAPGLGADVLSLAEDFLPQSGGTDGDGREGAGISRDKIPGWLAQRDGRFKASEVASFHQWLPFRPTVRFRQRAAWRWSRTLSTRAAKPARSTSSA